MRTLITDPPPPEIEAFLERRRKSGADLHDEVWEGVLHMAPAPRDVHGDVQHQVMVLLDGPAREAKLLPILEFNLGEPDDYRVPDGGLRRERLDATYYPSVALVVEIVSPGDETWDKLPFYAAHEVDEVLIVDPQQRSLQWLGLDRAQYQPIARSSLIELGPDELASKVDWP
jgi:Uma2 family endonuclease